MLLSYVCQCHTVRPWQSVSSPHNSGTDSSRRQSNNTAEGFIVLYSTDDHGQISLSCGLLPRPFLCCVLSLSSRVDDYKFNKSSNIYTLQGLPAGTSSLLVCLLLSFSFFFRAFPASEKPLSCLSAVLSVYCIVFLFHEDLIHNKRFAKIYKLLRLNEPDISRLAVSCVFLRVWFVFLSQNGTNFYNSIPWSSATSSFYLA